jgi:hypothetical protein
MDYVASFALMSSGTYDLREISERTELEFFFSCELQVSTLTSRPCGKEKGIDRSNHIVHRESYKLSNDPELSHLERSKEIVVPRHPAPRTNFPFPMS